MAQHNDLGQWGEHLAVAYLHNQGYIIRECDWKQGRRDIDIIALTPDNITCVFIEVKTRKTEEITNPEDAVDEKKMRNLGWAADSYVKQYNVQEELRFDIISIIGTCKENARIEHIIDAFNPILL